MQNEIGGLEPFTLTILETQHVTGESRSQIYARIGRGEYEAVKSGARTLILYESIKRRIASLPAAKIKPPKPRAISSASRPHAVEASKTPLQGQAPRGGVSRMDQAKIKQSKPRRSISAPSHRTRSRPRKRRHKAIEGAR